MLLGDLDPDSVGPSIAFATHYEPTPVRDARRLLDAIPLDPAQTTFVDVGAGMGRVVILAAEHGFRRVVGIEISPALLQVARDNVRALGAARTRVHLARADAACYRLPRENLAVYLFNPFRCEVLAALVRRLVTHPAEDVVVAYHTPVERAVIEETRAFSLIEDLGFGVVYRRRAHARP